MTEPASQPDPREPSVDEEVRYLPVPVGRPPAEAPPLPLERLRSAPLPAAAAAAAGGFLLGVAAFVAARVLRRRRGQRALGRALMRRGTGGEGAEIAGSRSFLVDIHLLRR